MNLTIKHDDFNKNYIYLCDPIKNFVIEDATFYKFLYSTPINTFNCILFDMTFTNVQIVKSYNKYKMIINKSNINLISFILNIEKEILSRINLSGSPQFDLFDNINMGFIKLYSKNILSEKIDRLRVTLKLSGIWKTDKKYGITYKFSV